MLQYNLPCGVGRWRSCTNRLTRRVLCWEVLTEDVHQLCELPAAVDWRDPVAHVVRGGVQRDGQL